MKFARSIPAALAVVAAASSMTATAGEISLFEGPGFGGRQVTLRGPAESVSGIGFNDRTSSIVVRSGRWEVCSDDGFRGQCAVFEPGQYPRLDGRFDKQVSSAREVASRGTGQPDVATAGIGSVDLYGQPGFQGKTLRLERDANNFSAYRYNDRASSVIVQGGTWELCTDADFGGTCRTFAPGRYPSLGYGMTKAISSARPVQSHDEARAIHGGGWNRHRRDESSNPIVLFSEDGASGRSLAVVGDLPDLSTANFNDATRSMVIESGYWEFCSDSYYRGQCRVMGPGQYQHLEPVLYRSISSIRTASRDGRNGTDANENRDNVELFTGTGFSGNRFPVSQDLNNFSDGGFNDKINSMVVNAGQWEMCVDSNYRGRCTVFGPGRYGNLGGLSNQLSSIRRVE